MFGSPHLGVNVLEFIVFEKNVTDLYGRWRLHSKIVPDWQSPVLQTVHNTKRLEAGGKAVQSLEEMLEDKRKEKEVAKTATAS